MANKFFMNKNWTILALIALSYNCVKAQSSNPESTTSIDEVVLTGFGKQNFVTDNPLPIKKISQKILEKSTSSNLVDILAKETQGLVSVKTGPNISKPFIRGLGYNRVLTLYNSHRQEGQQWGEEHGLELDSYDVGQVEIIKGPSSLMFGSDAIAGVISFFPNMPKHPNTEYLKATAEYQTNNNLIGTGFSWGKMKDHWFLAASSSLKLAKNYRNKADGRVYNTNFQEKNFSIMAGYRNHDNYSLLHLTYYNNIQGIPDGSRNPENRRFTKKIYEDDLDIVEERPEVSDKELNSYSIAPMHQQINHLRVYLNNKYNLSFGQLVANVGFQQNHRTEYNHPSQTSLAAMQVRLNTINYNIGLSSSLENHLEINLGANGMYQNNTNTQATDFPIPDYQLFDFGYFTTAKWKLSNLIISGGLRIDYRNLKSKAMYIANMPSTGFDQQVPADYPNAQEHFQAFEKNYYGFSASLGASYAITKNLDIKLNIGQAYRAPNITELASNGLDPGAQIIYLGNKDFKPEFSFQQDLSFITKYRDFSGEINLFNNHLKNYIYLMMSMDENGNPLINPQGYRTYQYQQSKAQLYGMDFYFALHPHSLKGWTFTNKMSVVYGYNKNKEFKNKGNEGEYLPLIPPLQWDNKLEKKICLQHQWIKDISPFFETEYNASQNLYLALNETETATPSYFLINLGVSTNLQIRNQHLGVHFSVHNLLDKVYQNHLSRLKYFDSAPNAQYSGIYNMGRNFSLKLVYQF